MSRILVVLAIAAFCAANAFSHRADEPQSSARQLTLAQTTALLSQPAGLEKPTLGQTIDEVFTNLEQRHHVTFRLDPTLFSKANGFSNAYETKIENRISGRLNLRDFLEEICAQFSGENRHVGIMVKAGQIMLGESYEIPAMPGSADEPQPLLTPARILRQFYGPTVDLVADGKSLEQIVAMLREQSGANIVIDPAIREIAETKLKLTLNDVKLLTVLRTLGTLTEAGVAVRENVYILTTPEKAEAIMSETERLLFGKPIRSSCSGTSGIPAGRTPIQSSAK